MVQIRPGSEASDRRAHKFWDRFKFKLWKRPLSSQPSISESRTNFLYNDYGESQGREARNVRQFSRAKRASCCVAQKLALAKAGISWGQLDGSKFIIRAGDAMEMSREVCYSGSTDVEQKENVFRKLTDKVFSGAIARDAGNFRKKLGVVCIRSWMAGKRSLSRKPLIYDESVGEREHCKSQSSKTESSKLDSCFGCTGSALWRSKGKCTKQGRPNIESVDYCTTLRESGSTLNEGPPALPDDILEMCLAWTPFVSLIRVRAVCKKWKALTLTPHFLQLRERFCAQEQWLFVFGLSRDGVCLGQIQALDPDSNTWHSITAKNLTGRLLFSVVAVNSTVYVIGGCSTNLSKGAARRDKSAVRTSKTVQVYSPLIGTWRNVCPMTIERASPIVGVFTHKDKRLEEASAKDAGNRTGWCQMSRVSDPHIELKNLSRRYPSSQRIVRRGGELAVFGEPDCSRDCNCNNFSKEAESRASKRDESIGTLRKTSKTCARDKPGKDQNNFGIIVVGGHGRMTEQLESAEIYDPVLDRWTEIASLPADHGAPCAGVVCKAAFYVYSQSNKLAAYDLEHEHWRSIQVSLGPARLLDYTPKLVACKERVFLLGVAWDSGSEGGREMATRKVWELYQEPSLVGWVSVSQHPDAPLDWNAIFVADDERIFGVEMFKIFGQMLDFVTICRVCGPKSMRWERVSGMQMTAHEVDPSSCLTKTAVVVKL